MITVSVVQLVQLYHLRCDWLIAVGSNMRGDFTVPAQGKKDWPCYTCSNVRGLQIVYKNQVNGTHHLLCVAVKSTQRCCIFTDWLLGNRKSGLVWKEYQKMKRSRHRSGVQWCQLLWKASYFFFFFLEGGFTCCWLGLLFLQSNHFISEGSRKKKNQFHGKSWAVSHQSD